MTDPENGNRKQAEKNGNGEWNRHCGSRLVHLRGACGFSQRQFAARLGVDARLVRYWEKEGKSPGPENKAAIVEVLGGPDHPRWDRPENLELACCLGIRVRPPDGRDPQPEEEQHQWKPGDKKQKSSPSTPPAPPPLPRIRLLLFLVPALLVVTILVIFVLRPRPVPVDVTIECGRPWTATWSDGSVRVLVAEPRHGEFYDRFRPDMSNTLIRDIDADGKPEIVIVVVDASRCDKPSGHIRIDCFSSDGTHRWSRFIDEAQTYRDGSMHTADEWSLKAVDYLDWNGDGRTEIAVLGAHMMYSSVLDIFDADGNRLSHYVNAGHMKDFAVLPASFYESITRQCPLPMPPARGSGAALAISAQTNEAPAGCQLIILPPGFNEGAYPARTPHYQHTVLAPARDAIFIRLRPTLVAQNHPAGHNWPDRVTFDATKQRIRIGTIEEPDGETILRFFDASLQQVSVIPTDRFRNKYPSMQKALHLAAIDSEEMAVSVEIIDVRQGEQWIARRSRGAWIP